MLVDRNSEAFKIAYSKIPEKFRRPQSHQDSWKTFRGTADEEIGRYLASVEGLLTWRQIFRLIRKKIATWLKDKDL